METKKKTNELVIKRKKKLLYRKTILFMIILISILCTLCIKLPYFGIQDIQVLGSKNVSKDDIIKLSTISKGENIFRINISKIKKSIKANPYIEDVTIKRQLPNKISLNIQERDIQYFIKENNKYYILDNKGVVLDIKDNMSNMDLVGIDGISSDGLKIGQLFLKDDKRKSDVLASFSDLLKRNLSDIKFSSIEFTQNGLINVHVNNISVILGNEYNLETKLNKAINILSINEVKGKSGYIDVSFEGNPVVSIKK